MTVEVLKPGLFSSFQDLGRTGHQHLGISVSGAMDELSHRLANLVLGNDEREATLEITLMGPTLRFAVQATVAWCGADLSPAIDGTPVPRATPTPVPAGATLQFGKRLSGMRAYLAVRGGFALAPVMGSTSTYARAGFGGYEGRALRKGDVLGLKSRGLPGIASVSPGTAAAVQRLHDELSGLTIRVLPGREWEQFGAGAQQTLLSHPYRIAAQSDRMGYRLEGQALERSTTDDVLSEAVCFGTMQVPPDGQPIVLMAERQTTGGYPKIVQVASVDLPRLAQRAPGESLRFVLIAMEKAQALLLARERVLRTLIPAV
ncbi:putative hydrolase subunit [Burkholderiales bacterium]|jgi:urea carboxylase|nr:putative hydrolase subunit [Burkholderiales bacterium]